MLKYVSVENIAIKEGMSLWYDSNEEETRVYRALNTHREIYAALLRAERHTIA